MLATKVTHAIPPLARVGFVYNKLYNPGSNAMYYQQFSAMTHLLQLFVVALTIHLLGMLPKPSHMTYATILGKLSLYSFWYTGFYSIVIAIFVLISDAHFASNPFYMVFVSFFYIIASQSIGGFVVCFYEISINCL